MHKLTIEDLRIIPYLSLEHLSGRTVAMMPLWDGSQWHVWVPGPNGLINMRPTDFIETDYIALQPALDSDLCIPFVELMWQQASWPEVCPLIHAICDDFHNMGTSVAKLHHIFNTSAVLPNGMSSRFASTEIEYIVILARTIFDYLQEIISLVWNEHIALLDPDADKYRQRRKLPRTFSKIVLRDKRDLRSMQDIVTDFRLPGPLSDSYSRIGPFFSELRDIRDSIVHRGGGTDHVFITEKGFCVSPNRRPFNTYLGWNESNLYNENLHSLIPWIANVITQTIDSCSALMLTFANIIKLPPAIAPGYHIYVRGQSNAELVELLRVRNGGSPWWGQ